MNCLFIINDQNKERLEFQLNQILAMLSFDHCVWVCFRSDGLQSLQDKSWKILELYLEHPIYYMGEGKPETLIDVEAITSNDLKQLISKSDLIL